MPLAPGDVNRQLLAGVEIGHPKPWFMFMTTQFPCNCFSGNMPEEVRVDEIPQFYDFLDDSLFKSILLHVKFNTIIHLIGRRNPTGRNGYEKCNICFPRSSNGSDPP